jgi:hypothetical protein
MAHRRLRIASGQLGKFSKGCGDAYALPKSGVRAGDTLFTLDEQRFGEVAAADPTARTLSVKKPIKLHGLHSDGQDRWRCRPDRRISQARQQAFRMGAVMLSLKQRQPSNQQSSPSPAVAELYLGRWLDLTCV